VQSETNSLHILLRAFGAFGDEAVDRLSLRDWLLRKLRERIVKARLTVAEFVLAEIVGS
jgi:hypothetical protein